MQWTILSAVFAAVVILVGSGLWAERYTLFQANQYFSFDSSVAILDTITDDKAFIKPLRDRPINATYCRKSVHGTVYTGFCW